MKVGVDRGRSTGVIFSTSKLKNAIASNLQCEFPHYASAHWQVVVLIYVRWKSEGVAGILYRGRELQRGCLCLGV